MIVKYAFDEKKICVNGANPNSNLILPNLTFP